MNARRLLLLTALVIALAGVVISQSAREGYIVTPDHVRLYYKVVGDGPQTLVVVHGGPGNSLTSIEPDFGRLATGRTVIYYDQRGNGKSDLLKDSASLAIDKHIADLEAVRQHFKLEKLTLLGNSWGGVLVSAYAAAHPDRIERMILQDPGEPTRAFAIEAAEEIQSRVDNHYSPEQRKRYAFVSNAENWVKAKDPRAICREFYEMLFPLYVSDTKKAMALKGDVCSGSEEAVRYQQAVNLKVWASLGAWDLTKSVAVVKAPVLVIHGSADPIPIESSETWAYSYPNARFLLIKGSGHMTHIEQPEIFFPAAEKFLNGEFPGDAVKVGRPPE